MDAEQLMSLVESCTTEKSLNTRLKIIAKVLREYDEIMIPIIAKEIGPILEETGIEEMKLK